MARRKWGVLALVACAVLGGCSTADGRGTTAAAQTTPSPTTDSPAPPAPPSAEPLRVAFLGDSYTAGVGSTDAGYVPTVADELGWVAVNLGESGTGYVNPGSTPGYTPYAGRLAAVAASDPDVVVVQGSTNDVGAPPAEVDRRATELYSALAAQLPDAEVVVVGPVSPPGVDGAGVVAVRDALAAAAAAASLPFVDPVLGGWLQPPDGLFDPDGIHPDDAGYAEIAERLTDALTSLGY